LSCSRTPLPPLAFIPLFIIWLRIGETPKEVLIMLGVTPIMAVTTVAALDEVPGDLRLCARTLGASPRYTMLRVQIRAALPGILTGCGSRWRAPGLPSSPPS
jgi:ABC-type nitrate/sulfonate/bicarbonate transport system permease component